MNASLAHALRLIDRLDVSATLGCAANYDARSFDVIGDVSVGNATLAGNLLGPTGSN
jgi:hypothetical protein